MAHLTRGGRVDTADGVLSNYHKDKGLNYVDVVGLAYYYRTVIQ